MQDLAYLPDVLILLSASIFIVVFLKRLKLSPVLGYLVFGAIIGEHGWSIVHETKYTHNLAEFGVVFLLFVIGLELTFDRLVRMRLYVFGYGGAQLVLTTTIIMLIIKYCTAQNLAVSVLLSGAFALSSTAIVLQVLAETKRQTTQVGRLALSVLLMQDFAVVPLLAVLPIIASGDDNIMQAISISSLKALGLIALITIVGRLFLRPFFSLIGSAQNEEVYVTTSLLIVLGAAWITNEMGLSTAMGAFLAGLLIAETEYRNKIEDSIVPFKGLFMGLFFITVGMSINIKFILEHFTWIILVSFLLLFVKGMIILALCRVFKFSWGASIHSSLLLSQGSEFAFILFGLAHKQQIITEDLSQSLLMVVAFTMAVTPLLSILGARIEDRWGSKKELDANQEYKGISDLSSHVIIGGFGRVGRVVAHMLSQEKINYVAVDSNASLVKKAREQGFPVYHGNLDSLETLKAVGAARASSVVITMSERVDVRKAIKTLSGSYKHLNAIARVDDYKQGKGLKKLGAKVTIPATVETGLQIGNAILRELGIAEHEILNMKEKFRKNEYSLVEDISLFKGAPQ